MSNEQVSNIQAEQYIQVIGNIGDKIAGETGITPREEAGAPAAQQAAEHAAQSATAFVADQMIAIRPRREPEEKLQGMTLVSPYSENELHGAEQLLSDAGIVFRGDSYREHKPHLLSALALASSLEIDGQDVVKSLSSFIKEEEKRLPYLQYNKATYQLASYAVEHTIVNRLAERKGIRASEGAGISDERRTFMEQLAASLDDKEKQELARYVASTQAGYSFSPFYSPVSFDVSTREGLRRQNIGVAIAPQSFEPEAIKDFLSQEGIRRESFLVAMANPHLREAMPLGALLAGEYRVTLQYSPSDRREVSFKEALEEQIERSYTERIIGSEPLGLLPFEELAGLVVINNLVGLPQEDLESRSAQVMPQVLEAEQPLSKLEEVFPDIGLFFDKREMDQLASNISALKEAIASPDKVPPRDFWYRAFTKPDKTSSFLSRVRDELTRKVYQIGGEGHLQRWRETVGCFAVSKEQERTGEPITLMLLNDHEIGVSVKDGIYTLIKREDGQWYPTSYWDRKSQKPTFGIEGKSYKELQQQIATSPFRYQVERDFLREVLRGSLNELATRVYEQIKSQVDLEAINNAGFYPSHAATAYREEGPLRDFQYLIGSMTPYGVGTYDSIFSAFVRHMWQHKMLSETDLSIAVPLTGESVTVRQPLLELQDLSFEKIQDRLKKTGTDVRVPEITIRKSGGFELRAKAWVYQALLKLKDLGFDAVLGKTMAEEFNRQAARIYVESALADLAFLPKDYQKEKPLTLLQSRQQTIYSQALKLDFTIPLEGERYLDPRLSLPLTWERENQLWNHLKSKMSEEDFQKFVAGIEIDPEEYFKSRPIYETFLDFASGWKWSQFDRSNEFPTYTYRISEDSSDFGYGMKNLSMTRSPGEYAVSTQAQEKFTSAKKTWTGFLEEIKRQISPLDASWKQRISPIVDLGKGLVAEIDKMSQAEVTEWAEKIIKGEMAAVGRDMQKPIDVKTWADFYEAIVQLMDTARLVLIYRSEKSRFGWEVSTDKEEVS